MPTSLRTLLDAASSAQLGVVDNPTVPLRNSVQGSTMFLQPLCAVVYDDNHCRNFLCCWCPPSGTTAMTFEIWGGGGGGAGACCCSYGFPGGSGAYAKKSISGANLGGICYQMFVAYPSCCSPVMSCGYRGCVTWVTGCCLSNFCAEGGVPGCTYCFPFNCFNCGIYCEGQGSGRCFANCCACYYGADTGVPGRMGFLYTDSQTANSCQYKNLVPHPGGILSSGNMWSGVRFDGYNSTGSGESCYPSNFGFTGGSISKAVGQGGFSSSAFSGNCYCGGPGGPGLIKITYR